MSRILIVGLIALPLVMLLSVMSGGIIDTTSTNSKQSGSAVKDVLNQGAVAIDWSSN